MRKFILAAVAALTLGMGSAYAAQTVTNNAGQVILGRPTAATHRAANRQSRDETIRNAEGVGLRAGPSPLFGAATANHQ